jgi:hypothetical protein
MGMIGEPAFAVSGVIELGDYERATFEIADSAPAARRDSEANPGLTRCFLGPRDGKVVLLAKLPARIIPRGGKCLHELSGSASYWRV